MLQDMDARPTTPASGIDARHARAQPSSSRRRRPTGSPAPVWPPAITAKFDRALDPAERHRPERGRCPARAGGRCRRRVALLPTRRTPSTLTPAQPLAVGTQYTATLEHRDAGDRRIAAAVADQLELHDGRRPVLAVRGQPRARLRRTYPVQDGRAGKGPFSYEMGVRSRCSRPLQLTAIRFYKDAGETGTHTGRVWKPSGQVIGQTTFTGESASGWQQQSLADAVDAPARPGVHGLGRPERLLRHDSARPPGPDHERRPAERRRREERRLRLGRRRLPDEHYKSSNYFVDLVAQ